MDDKVDRQGIVRGRSNLTKGNMARNFRRNLTTAEAHLWEILRANRLEGLHFRRQHIIDGFIVDFYCHKAALIVEVDGSIHATQIEYDAARDRHLTSRSLRIVRVSNDDVLHNIDNVRQQIINLCIGTAYTAQVNSSL